MKPLRCDPNLFCLSFGLAGDKADHLILLPGKTWVAAKWEAFLNFAQQPQA